MVKITLITRNNSFVSFEAKGHTGIEGESLVCAAVSAIIKCGANALKDDKYVYEDKDGYFYLEATGEISEHDAIVIETITTQIECLAKSYGEEVRLERKNRK